MGPGPKKKGIASSAPKRTPKRPKPGSGPTKQAKKLRTSGKGSTPAGSAAGAGTDDDDDESDNGPYCLCRGPDDHRWMIFCENCEDWFHGECINLRKDIGESLIEKFICPNCTSENLTTIYKKICALGACRKAARMADKEPSVFCSHEHAQAWWERMVGKLAKTRGKGGLSDQLAQDELMALLGSNLTGVDSEGVFKVAQTPFSGELPKAQDGDGKFLLSRMSYESTKKSANLAAESMEDSDPVLTAEEKSFLGKMAEARYALAQETLLCHKMLTLIELAQERRRTEIAAGNLPDDACGYDPRLDTISARDSFAGFVKSPEGEATFKNHKLGDPPEGMYDREACDKKRCKIHGGWAKMLVTSIKHQIREMAGEAAEVEEEEKLMKVAAGERWRRKKAENNWVEVLDG